MTVRLARTEAYWLGGNLPAAESELGLAEPYRLQIEGHAEKAAQLWTDLGCSYEAALTWHDTADEAALREALRIFTDLGASATARVTRQRMRQLGIRSIPAGPRTATRAHPLARPRPQRRS